MKNTKKRRKLFIVSGIFAILMIAGVAVWLHGPVIPAAKGPFITKQQAREMAEKQIASTVANPPFSDLEWTKDTKVTYLQPEYDLAGNVVAYECRVDTNGQKTGGISIWAQGKGSISGYNTAGQATCDLRTQTALGRDAQEGDYIINGTICGYDAAVRQKDGTYVVAQMFDKPKVISERAFYWLAWWNQHNPLRNYFA